jgi:nucleotide-binding universal stress UspA family protein
MFSRVLAPLDGSALSEQALEHAGAMAEKFGARITLLYAYEGLDQAAAALSQTEQGVDRAEWERIHRSTESALAAIQAYLDRHARALSERGVEVETRIVDVLYSGSPAGAILEVAREAPDTVVVMSTHGRGGLGRVIFGSTAQKVLELSPVPILMIRAAERGRRGRT